MPIKIDVGSLSASIRVSKIKITRKHFFNVSVNLVFLKNKFGNVGANVVDDVVLAMTDVVPITCSCLCEVKIMSSVHLGKEKMIKAGVMRAKDNVVDRIKNRTCLAASKGSDLGQGRNSVADGSRRTAWRRRRVTRGRFFVGRCVGRHHCISGMMDQVEDLRKAEII